MAAASSTEADRRRIVCVGSVGRRCSRGSATTLVQHEVDRRPVDALGLELGADRSFAARAGAISRLDPGAAEGLVVEDAELEEAGRRSIDELRAIAGLGQATTDLGDRARACFEEARGGLEDDLRVVDGGPFGPSFGVASRAAAGHRRVPALLGLFDPLDRDRDRGHLGPDLLLDLRRDRRVRLQELLRGLAALAEA